jgi:hypothetical protein
LLLLLLLLMVLVELGFCAVGEPVSINATGMQSLYT